MKHVINILVIFSCIALTACGGSGGNTSVTPADTTVSNNWDEMNWDQGSWQ